MTIKRQIRRLEEMLGIRKQAIGLVEGLGWRKYPEPNVIPPDDKPVFYQDEYMTKAEFYKRAESEGLEGMIIEIKEADNWRERRPD